MMRQALATFCSSWARCSNESFRRVLWAKAAIRNLLSDGLSQQLPISQKAGWSPLCFLQPAPAATCRIITALLHEGADATENWRKGAEAADRAAIDIESGTVNKDRGVTGAKDLRIHVAAGDL